MEHKVSKFNVCDTVQIDVRQSDEEIVIKKVNKAALPTRMSPDFLETLSQVMDEDDETLKGLKDR